jgi:hypothetical protein
MTRMLFMGCAVLFLAAATSVMANDEQDGKKKGKGAPPSIVEIDLSKLPPDLAKELKKYSMSKGEKGKGEKGKEVGKGKAKKDSKTTSETRQLPPGLARKPVDHPGRVAWLKAHGVSEKTAPTPKKGPSSPPMEKKKKGEAQPSSDLDQRLERLTREIEELRREIRKKK